MKKIYLTIALLIASSLTLFAQIPTDSLVAHWAFDGDTLDSSGNGHHGSRNGNVTLTDDRFGNPNHAYHFDDNAWIETSAFFSTSNRYKSFSIWFKPDTADRGWVISGGANATGEAFGLFMDSPASPDMIFHGHGAADKNFGGVSLATWHHMVITYDGGTVTGYVDGLLAGTKVITLATDSTSIIIGARQGLGAHSEKWLGSIDDVRIYDQALSAAEVTALFNEADPLTAIADPAQSIGFTLYPNPTQSQLFIEIEDTPESITVLSLEGRVLRQIENQNSIDVSDLAAGMYIARVTTNKGVGHQRFIKQ